MGPMIYVYYLPDHCNITMIMQEIRVSYKMYTRSGVIEVRIIQDNQDLTRCMPDLVRLR